MLWLSREPNILKEPQYSYDISQIDKGKRRSETLYKPLPKLFFSVEKYHLL
jgi:hypothetical protein